MARKPKIIAHTGREASEPPAVAHLLLLLCGVCALLLPMTEGLRYSVPRTILLAVSLCVFLWTMARIGWRWAVLCSMLCATLWCLACIVLQEELSAQLTEAVKLIFSSGADGRTVDFSLCAPLFAVLLVLLFFSSELLIGSHVLPYSLTLALFLLGPLIKARPSVEAAVLALLFQFGYWAMNGSGMRQSRFDFALPSRARLTALTGAVTSGILAAVLLIAVPLAMRDNESLYAPAYAAEGFLKRAVSRLSGADGTPITDGKLNRGNLYPTGTAHLRLRTNRKPSAPVYLRGFYGSAYLYGTWDREIEKEIQIFQDMATDWRAGWELGTEQRNMLAGSLYRNFEGMYWRLNRLSSPESADIRMTVQRGDGQYLDAYTPYYGAWKEDRFELGPFIDPSAVSFYEQDKMQIDWENVPDADTCKWMETHYQQRMQSLYTQVPTERVPRLAQLCRDNPLTDLDDITAFILHTLQSKASYSLTPGWTPVTEDFVEHFLFESGLGYCQHFASAATLMYRLYGVPARYATGYVATPDDFINMKAVLSSQFPFEDDGEEGDYTAILSDFSAHAWTEIFLPGYGWTPVEVTPDADGSVFPSYPGLNLDALAQRLAELDFAFPETGRNAVSGHTEQSLVATFAKVMSRQTRKSVSHAFRTLFLCVPALAVAGLYYRRRRRLAFYAQADCRVTFGRLLSLLRFSGALPDCDGQEADFPQRFAEAVPTVSEADAVRMRRDAQAAAYGPGTLPADADTFARQLYQRAADSLYDGLSLWKRFLFRWRHLYG